MPVDVLHCSSRDISNRIAGQKMLLPSSSGASCGRERNIFIAAVVAGLVLLPSATAWADWVLGAYVGNAATLSSTVVLTQPDRQTELEIAGVEYRGESFKFPLYYGYRVTWIPDRYRWLGIEAEYIHAKVFSQTDQSVNVRGTLDGVPVEGSVQLSSIVQRLAMSHGLNFFFGSVAVRRELGFVDSLGTPRLVAIARVGAGPTMPHTEVTIGSEHVDQYESGGLGMQVGGGLQFTVWEGVGVVGEYKFTWATPTISVPGGEVEIPARSHHFVGGITYTF